MTGTAMEKPSADLADTVVIVTGAATGVGRALAKGLSDHGATVVAALRGVTGRNAPAVSDFAALGIGSVECDVGSTESVEAAVAEVLERHGQVDIVVNNAGISITGPVEAATIEDLQQLFETNVYGPHRMNRAVLPAMKRRGSGLIIQISSSAGRWVQPGNGAYAASKWALEAMSEALRWELGEFGIDCCLIELGSFQSELLSAKARHVSDEDRAQEYVQLAEMKRQDHERRFLGDAPTAAMPEEIVDPLVQLIRTKRGERPLRLAVHAYKDALDAYNDLQTSLSAAVFAERGYDSLTSNGLVYTRPEHAVETKLF